MDVNVRHLLSGSRPIVNQHEEVFGSKDRAQATLGFSNTVHEEAPFLGLQIRQPRHAALWNNQRVTRPAWKHIKESVPAFASGHRMRRNVATDDAFEQRRLAHKPAWQEAVLNPHAESVGASTQWPETPFRTARVPVVPSEDTRVWCIWSASMSGWS